MNPFRFYLNRLKLIVRDAKEDPKPYQSGNLDLIVSKSLKRMKLIPYCPQCKTQMSFRFSHLVNNLPRRDDLTFKCKKCFHTTHFGIPITAEEYREDMKLRNGSEWIMFPEYNASERSNDAVMKRLRDLGYLA